jgi:hypothetical protein
MRVEKIYFHNIRIGDFEIRKISGVLRTGQLPFALLGEYGTHVEKAMESR